MRISIEDRLAIQELVQRYAFYIDSYRIDEVMTLFADDLVFDETRIGGAVARSKAELRRTYDTAVELFYMAHISAAGFVDQCAGGRARGIAPYQAVVRLKKTGAPWQVNGYYDDEYVQRDGRWLFRSRTVIPLIPPDPFPAMAECYADPAS